MLLMALRRSMALPPLSLLLTGALLLMMVPRGARADKEAPIYEKWEEISMLRSTGQFARAVELIDAIAMDPANPEGVLRRAHNHLVFTYFLMQDAARAEAAARAALEQFPDLNADPIEFPPRVDATYDLLRKEMFGSLAIHEPAEACVFLDGRAVGNTPLVLEFVPTGEHDLVAAKPGHSDYCSRIRIDGGGEHSFELFLDRARDTRWWIWRAGAAALAGALLLVGLRGAEDAQQSAETALPEPPDPPSP